MKKGLFHPQAEGICIVHKASVREDPRRALCRDDYLFDFVSGFVVKGTHCIVKRAGVRGAYVKRFS